MEMAIFMFGLIHLSSYFRIHVSVFHVLSGVETTESQFIMFIRILDSLNITVLYCFRVSVDSGMVITHNVEVKTEYLQ